MIDVWKWMHDFIKVMWNLMGKEEQDENNDSIKSLAQKYKMSNLEVTNEFQTSLPSSNQTTTTSLFICSDSNFKG